MVNDRRILNWRKTVVGFLGCTFGCSLLVISTTVGLCDDDLSASEIYKRRILPLLQSSDRSSCSQCHLQGVELRDFLHTDQSKTFADLQVRGWIDVANPQKSKLLAFIQRQPENSNPLQEKVRAAELAALEEWISAAVKEPELLKVPVPTTTDLELPIDFIRHARTDQIAARFSEAVWSQLQRCANCHSPDRNQKQVEKNGEQMSWIVPNRPLATLELLTERGLIDLENPEKSELRTKPLGLIEHGGGPKFPSGSTVDRAWLSFLEDYSKTVRSVYRPSDDLPKLPSRRSWLSELQLRLTDLPADWKGRMLTVTLHAIHSDETVAKLPTVVADSSVNPKQLVWQNQFTIFSEVKSKAGEVELWATPLIVNEAIPTGRYEIQVRLGELVLNSEGKPIVTTSSSARPKLVATGQLEAPWPLGYQPPLIVSFGALKRLD